MHPEQICHRWWQICPTHENSLVEANGVGSNGRRHRSGWRAGASLHAAQANDIAPSREGRHSERRTTHCPSMEPLRAVKSRWSVRHLLRWRGPSLSPVRAAGEPLSGILVLRVFQPDLLQTPHVKRVGLARPCTVGRPQRSGQGSDRGHRLLSRDRTGPVPSYVGKSARSLVPRSSSRL